MESYFFDGRNPAQTPSESFRREIKSAAEKTESREETLHLWTTAADAPASGGFLQMNEEPGSHCGALAELSYAAAVISFRDEAPVSENFNFQCSRLIREGLPVSELLRLPEVKWSLRTGIPCGRQIRTGKQAYRIWMLPLPALDGGVRLVLIILPVIRETPEPDGGSRLTPREAEAAELASRGYSNRYIAHRLSISEGTVKKLLYNGYQKLGVSSRVELSRTLGEEQTAPRYPAFF